MVKKILYLLVALLPLWCVSCSDDDDGEPTTTKDGKRLVAKIIEVNYDDRTETTFEYDKSARLEKVVEKYYSDDYLEEEFSVMFSYSTDKIVGKVIDGGEGGVGELTHHTATFILNGQGYISEYEIVWNPKGEDEWMENGTFVYNDKGQLVEETYTESEYIDLKSFEYIWNDDELVKVIEEENGWTTTYSYFYTDQENEVNFDFNRLLGRGSMYYLEALGYMGKPSSRNFPKKCEGKEVSYKFDGEGYPVEIEHDGNIYTIEYK